MRDTEGSNKKLPTENGEESSLVAKRVEISNLLTDISEIMRLSEILSDSIRPE
jgi:hypothetical protein